MLPEEFNSEIATDKRRSRVEIVSHPRSESNARSNDQAREKNLLRWILLMRTAIQERRSVEGREKIRRGDAEKGRVPFERSYLLLVFDVSEEIMPCGMW